MKKWEVEFTPLLRPTAQPLDLEGMDRHLCDRYGVPYRSDRYCYNWYVVIGHLLLNGERPELICEELNKAMMSQPHDRELESASILWNYICHNYIIEYTQIS